MKKWYLLPLAVLCICSFVGFYFTKQFYGDGSYSTKNTTDHVSTGEDTIHILITVCNGGDSESRQSMVRYRQVVDLLITIQRYGSIQTDANCGNRTSCIEIDDTIIVHIFTDDANTLREKFLEALPTSKLIDSLDVRTYQMPEPESEHHDYNKFHECASSRLYAPYLFEASKNQTGGGIDVPEQVLYLDTDTLVTTRLRKLWDSSTAMFQQHPNALFAMTQECMLKPEMGPYFFRGYEGENVTGMDGKTHHVYIFPNGTCQGYNSGVLVAHLHRWQSNNFSEIVAEQEQFALRHRYEMAFGDQGILNAIAARFPERLLELPCYWNMRTDTMEPCLAGYRDNGGGIVHGNRGIFYRNPAAVRLRAYLVGNDTEKPADLIDLLAGIFQHNTR